MESLREDDLPACPAVLCSRTVFVAPGLSLMLFRLMNSCCNGALVCNCWALPLAAAARADSVCSSAGQPAAAVAPGRHGWQLDCCAPRRCKQSAPSRRNMMPDAYVYVWPCDLSSYVQTERLQQCSGMQRQVLLIRSTEVAAEDRNTTLRCSCCPVRVQGHARGAIAGAIFSR